MPLVLEDITDYAPVILHGPPMTDDEFLAFCHAHEDLRVESTAEGELELMPLPGPDTGGQNADIIAQIGVWSLGEARGRTFDCSSTFGLPSNARRAPDAAWISKSRMANVQKSERGKVWHTCPEFVIELRSPSDRPRMLRAKMLEWISSGAQLAWLVDPFEREVTIYRPGREPEILVRPDTVVGEGPVAGFTLDLTRVWAMQDEVE